MFAAVEKIVAVVERMFAAIEKIVAVVERMLAAVVEAEVQSMTAEEFGWWKGVRAGREEGGRGGRTMVE